MVLSVVDNQGRILIPKCIRKQIGLRPGQQVRVQLQDNAAVITATNTESLKQLKGCIQTSDIDSLELKRLWIQ
ncbi:MAG: AbrB/MazE/SpoVT family DNA-binding domain-containing protein [Candidatus Woesearchaeota archaeon]